MNIGSLQQTPQSLCALVPSIVTKYTKEGFSISIESDLGAESFYSNHDYQESGASIQPRDRIIRESDVLLVDTYIDQTTLDQTKKEAIIIGRFNPMVEKKFVASVIGSNRTIFSLDMVPRSSIAQSMDILSSLASLSGYKAVVLAANHYSGYFPMMSTAAGTVPPAKVLVIGAGVAGLQAIATAKRLGAVIEAFDVRSAVKEEVQSLGAKFIEVDGGKEDQSAGGYAIEQSEEYIKKQKDLIHDRAVKADIIITTANIPGKKAPLLIEKRTAEAMKPGSIIIDMATASGGNCEVAEDNETINYHGITIIGDSSLFLSLPKEASRLYSTNLFNFVKFLFKDGIDNMPYDHEILQKTSISKMPSIKIAI